MEKLKAKLRRQGGFTLVELLIVVAIIAILVAVSIPMMNSVLEKSRHAVDQANERDAIALAATKVLTNEWDGKTTTTYYYHVNDEHIGNLDTIEADAVKSECTCTSGTGDHATSEKGVGQNKTLKVTVTPAADATQNPDIKAEWTPIT